jgi:hypothetical protein
MKKIALKLIEFQSKIWLAEKLGISRVTLDTRIEKDNWKKGEMTILIQLEKTILIS